jgi:hypothetical protein
MPDVIEFQYYQIIVDNKDSRAARLHPFGNIVPGTYITKEDMERAKLQSDILGTVSTLNDYYYVAPGP